VDFSFSDEQDLLRDSIRKYLSAKYDASARIRIVTSTEGYSRECWQEFAELGFLAASFAEEYGSIGGGAVETMIIMEECGRRLVIEPFVGTVVLAGGLLRDFGSEDQRQADCHQRSVRHPRPSPRPLSSDRLKASQRRFRPLAAITKDGHR
jgi:alkylation response protein AidB-like acyl-CoA dehydrogenase